MTATLLRVVASVLVALSITLGAAGAALAADPTPSIGTIGARVAGFVIADEDPQAWVINTGTVAMTFEATAPDGWTVSPKSITLDPAEEGHFTLTGSGDGGNLTVIGYGAAAASATGDATRIKFGSIRVMATRPYDWTRLIPAIGGGLTGLIALAFSLRWVRRHVRIVNVGAHA